MNIPKQAKRVFKGKIFDVYQWQQKMFNDSYETFEMLKRPNTIEVLPIMGDKIVLINEEQPILPLQYGIIGGRQDKNETPLECAKRELLEETGLASDDWELWLTHEPFNKIEWTMHRFIARNCKKVAKQKLDSGERIQLKFVSFDKFMKIITGDNFRSQDLTLDALKICYTNKLKEFRKKLFK